MERNTLTVGPKPFKDYMMLHRNHMEMRMYTVIQPLPLTPRFLVLMKINIYNHIAIQKIAVVVKVVGAVTAFPCVLFVCIHQIVCQRKVFTKSTVPLVKRLRWGLFQFRPRSSSLLHFASQTIFFLLPTSHHHYLHTFQLYSTALLIVCESFVFLGLTGVLGWCK